MKTSFISLESERVRISVTGFLVDAVTRFLSDNVDVTAAELRDVARVVTVCAELSEHGKEE